MDRDFEAEAGSLYAQVLRCEGAPDEVFKKTLANLARLLRCEAALTSLVESIGDEGLPDIELVDAARTALSKESP